MIPLNYDVIISIFCLLAGIYAMRCIGCFSNRYTPALAAIMISAGLVAWLTITLLSLSAIFKTPPWGYVEGWKGSWGYTASRVFMAVMWILSLVHVSIYAPKFKSESKAEL